MNTKQMNQYGKKLCKDIKLHYLKDFCLCGEDDNWNNLCQLSMRNFALSRRGWEQSDNSDDVFIFLSKYPITVNTLHSESAGMLMINTAIEIAKTELSDNFAKDKNHDLENNVTKIIRCIGSQDWTIPFIRNKKNFIAICEKKNMQEPQ